MYVYTFLIKIDEVTFYVLPYSDGLLHITL